MILKLSLAFLKLHAACSTDHRSHFRRRWKTRESLQVQETIPRAVAAKQSELFWISQHSPHLRIPNTIEIRYSVALIHCRFVTCSFSIYIDQELRLNALIALRISSPSSDQPLSLSTMMVRHLIDNTLNLRSEHYGSCQ